MKVDIRPIERKKYTISNHVSEQIYLRFQNLLYKCTSVQAQNAGGQTSVGQTVWLGNNTGKPDRNLPAR